MKYPLATKVLIAAGLLTVTGLSATAQTTTLFDDTFDTGNDTFQQASPTAPEYNGGDSYASYEYFQTQASVAAPSVSSDQMDLTGVTGSSEFDEIQAQFTSAPVTLSFAGDYILNLNIVFVDTANIMPSGNVAAVLNIGMYNSGGVAPAQGQELESGNTVTGGTLGWQGYVGRIASGSASAEVLTRPTQTGTLAQDQDVLFNDASSSSTYDTPKGAQVGSTGTAISGLTQGDTYTMQLQYTLNANGSITVLNQLFSGSDIADTGTALYDLSATTGTSPVSDTFDSLALGWRYDATSAANGIDIDQIDVTATPEPSVFALGGLGGLSLLGLGRFRRRS